MQNSVSFYRKRLGGSCKAIAQDSDGAAVDMQDAFWCAGHVSECVACVVVTAGYCFVT